MSDRGTAIQCFNSVLPNFEQGKLSLEEFRKTVTASIAQALNMSFEECGYLFNKARRNAERKGCPLEFGSAKRAGTIDKDPENPTQQNVVHATVVREGKVSRKREDLNAYTVAEVLGDGCIGRSYSYSTADIAQVQHVSHIKRHHGTWVVIKGLGPNPGEEYRLRDGEQELIRSTV